MADIFHVEGLRKRRGGDFALGPLDLRLTPAEVLGVMGPNGAGKTTLLRLLWGFLRPDEGRVMVFGRTPHLEQVGIRLRAGYLPEAPRFYDWMTVSRFLSFMAGFYPSWDWKRALELVDRFELDSAKTIGALSKGTRIKLGLVAAASHRPQLLILDEPTSGLDPVIRVEILEFLRHVAREEGVGIVLSSHVSDDLDRIADSVLMLDGGAMLEYAPAATLLARHNQAQLEAVFLHAVTRVRASRPAPRA